ncbi:MAG: GDSL-type esterase/lipase family protein [Candidatus Cryptobacteroides sp.]
MSKIKFFALILSFISIGALAQVKSDWAGLDKYAEANVTAPRNANAVFIGNSITEGWGKRSPEFFSDNGYICRGSSGQVSSQMLLRFRNDVINLSPKCVVILAGTNDIAQNKGYISLENIFGNIVSMCELAKANKIKPVICSVLPVFDYPWRKGLEPAEKIIKLNGMLEEYCKKEKIAYVDFHKEMKDERNGLPEVYSKDGVHPTVDGFKKMEEILQPYISKTIKNANK